MKQLLSTICAASVAAVAANASVISIDLTLAFQGTTYDEVEIEEPIGVDDDGLTEYSIETFTILDGADDRWGLSRAFPGLAVGDRIRFKGDIDPHAEFGLGTATNCVFGAYDCDTSGSDFGTASVSGNRISISNDGISSDPGLSVQIIEGSTSVGDTIDFVSFDQAGTYEEIDTTVAEFGEPIYAYWFTRFSSFVVVEDNSDAPLAPMPLPPAALGLIAAFALLYRRRIWGLVRPAG